MTRSGARERRGRRSVQLGAITETQGAHHSARARIPQSARAGQGALAQRPQVHSDDVPRSRCGRSTPRHALGSPDGVNVLGQFVRSSRGPDLAPGRCVAAHFVTPGSPWNALGPFRWCGRTLCGASQPGGVQRARADQRRRWNRGVLPRVRGPRGKRVRRGRRRSPSTDPEREDDYTGRRPGDAELRPGPSATEPSEQREEACQTTQGPTLELAAQESPGEQAEGDQQQWTAGGEHVLGTVPACAGSHTWSGFSPRTRIRKALRLRVRSTGFLRLGSLN